MTDQEKAFARLVLTGTMSDERAAQQVGMEPGSAAFVKAEPGVVAFMQQQREALAQQMLTEQADTLDHPFLARQTPRSVTREILTRETSDRRTLARARVIHRLWELANVSPAATRGSIRGQLKALKMIVAVAGLLPAEAGSAFGSGAAALPEGTKEVWASLKTSGKPN